MLLSRLLKLLAGLCNHKEDCSTQLDRRRNRVLQMWLLFLAERSPQSRLTSAAETTASVDSYSWSDNFCDLSVVSQVHK